ncbi:Anthranilate synthase alpha subunit 2, chloroplastic [Ananas comosus]|uniref:Anthranilate synthase alpha subunit 2, chloroplastic n=1 Tax=Ananas comosus TaxID=4615 RepID=A0A199UQB6_ANACO|nr:Anthranilate synthase alpha subunit 2, chloroplastic [Ananas comosus]
MESLAFASRLRPSSNVNTMMIRRRPAPAEQIKTDANILTSPSPSHRRSPSSSFRSFRCSAVSAPSAVVSGTATGRRPLADSPARLPPEPVTEGADEFAAAAKKGSNLVPLYQCIFSDHLTPLLAYRCLVPEDDKEAPSFLFESVQQGSQGATMGRYSVVGARPTMEIVAKENVATITDHEEGRTREETVEDPMQIPRRISETWSPQLIDDLPDAFCGGWVGFFSYDTMRYVEKKKLPFSNACQDDRNLPDVHLGLYNDVIVFDHVEKKAYVIHWVHLDRYSSVEEAYKDGRARLDVLLSKLHNFNFHLIFFSPTLSPGSIKLHTRQFGLPLKKSSVTSDEYKKAVMQAKEHISAGDIFQIVLSQRFERRTFADPFEVYRALRVVNPSPYMTYLQARGCVLVASSPEILTSVKNGKIVNRPLAGTVRRGKTEKEDELLEQQLLNDEKQCAEHIMLVDLGRNDVGRVSKPGSVEVEKLMNIERYSHVMHISSTFIYCNAKSLSFPNLLNRLFTIDVAKKVYMKTLQVTGELFDHLTCWDALRTALPAGTVSGAPKVKAMELIDQLEATRRGPYSGGFGGVSFSGNMDIALTLRTIVFPTGASHMYSSSSYGNSDLYKKNKRREWVAHLQAGAGIVADSNPDDEQRECENKAAALARAIDLAESAFGHKEAAPFWVRKEEKKTKKIDNSKQMVFLIGFRFAFQFRSERNLGSKPRNLTLVDGDEENEESEKGGVPKAMTAAVTASRKRRRGTMVQILREVDGSSDEAMAAAPPPAPRRVAPTAHFAPARHIPRPHFSGRDGATINVPGTDSSLDLRFYRSTGVGIYNMDTGGLGIYVHICMETRGLSGLLARIEWAKLEQGTNEPIVLKRRLCSLWAEMESTAWSWSSGAGS